MWPSEIQDIPLPAKVSHATLEPSAPITTSLRFIRLPQVMELTSLCRSAVLALDGFPQPVQLGSSRAKAWVESEILLWMKQQLQRREAGAL